MSEETKPWNVKVVLEFEYEVEADTEAEAEAEGWKYEDYMHWSTVYSIDVEDITPEPDNEETEETV